MKGHSIIFSFHRQWIRHIIYGLNYHFLKFYFFQWIISQTFLNQIPMIWLIFCEFSFHLFKDAHLELINLLENHSGYLWTHYEKFLYVSFLLVKSYFSFLTFCCALFALLAMSFLEVFRYFWIELHGLSSIDRLASIIFIIHFLNFA